MPSDNTPKFSGLGIYHIDKIVHFGMYAVLTYLCLMALDKLSKRNIILTLVLITLYSIAIEYIQFAMKLGRHFDIWDIMANFIGVMIAFIFFRMRVMQKN